MDSRPILVSACLAGLRTRYDGRGALCDSLIEGLGDRVVVPVCPEQLGGLPTPRPVAWIALNHGTGSPGAGVIDGACRVVDEHGADVTGNFIAGARAVVEIARITGAQEAVMKERSPSCGVTVTHTAVDGVSPGPGVAAEALSRAGVRVRGA